jgi:hypothetical protein
LGFCGTAKIGVIIARCAGIDPRRSHPAGRAWEAMQAILASRLFIHPCLGSYAQGWLQSTDPWSSLGTARKTRRKVLRLAMLPGRRDSIKTLASRAAPVFS